MIHPWQETRWSRGGFVAVAVRVPVGAENGFPGYIGSAFERDTLLSCAKTQFDETGPKKTASAETKQVSKVTALGIALPSK